MRNRLTSVTILFVISLASAGISAFEYMPLQDIQPGMKCYAYSSFSPNTLEKMEKAMTEIFEKICRKYFEYAEKFFYEVDDSEVEEWAEDNDYCFTEDGKIFD